MSALHCWKDYTEQLADVHGWGTDAYWEAWGALWDEKGEHMRGATCMLEADHPGDHKFTSDDEIIVEFVEEPPASGVRVNEEFDVCGL